MNAIEFTNELNALIARALQEGIAQHTMDPSQIAGALFMQATQLTTMWQMNAMAAMQAKQAGHNGIILPNGRLPGVG